MDDDLNRRYNEAFDMLPPLTRVAYILASVDGMAYTDIAWRCGIDVAEVELRLVLGLSSTYRAFYDRPSILMLIRILWRPWRGAWARRRLRRRHRRMGIVDRL